MSHHINFNIATPEVNSPSSKSSKNDSKSAKKREIKKLEIDNKQMEWRLRQLKLAMEREKEERGKKNYIWQSGKDGALESHARNILGKTVKSKTGQSKNSGKVKVSVLTDEPLNIPKRKSHSKDLIDKLMKPTPPPPLPQSKLPSNNLSPEVKNKECWISIGIDRFSEDVMDVQSDHNGNLPLSTLQGLNPSAIGLYYMRYGRKRLLLAIDSIVIQPKSGWGSDTYYPYIADISPQKLKLEPTPPSSVRMPMNKTLETTVNNNGGLLLNGSFNEEENAKAFQEAVMSWRNGKTTKDTPVKSGANNKPMTSVVETTAHGVQSDPEKSVEIKFSQTSSLSFMEKVLLKKHRVTDIPPLSDNAQHTNGIVSNAQEQFLTSEELDEKERYRSLFTALPNIDKKLSSSEFHSHVCNISEADNDEKLESSSYCFVEEVSDSDDFDEKHELAKRIFDDSPQDDNSCKTEIKEVNFAEPLTSLSVNNVKASETTSSNYFTPDKKIDVTSQKFPEEKMTEKVRENDSLNNIKVANSLKFNVTENKSNEDIPFSDVVSAISRIPFNPDAVYHDDLDHYCSEMHFEQSKIYNCLDSEPNQIMLCARVESKWCVPQSIEHRNVEYTSDDNVKSTDLRAISDVNENDERELEDYETLEKLEWELASQNGHITDDGRISRIIDDWSSDENDIDLGIVNDPGFGSGLSTPDPEPITLVGTSISWQDDSKMVQEFQNMEDFMLERESLDSNLKDSDSCSV